MLKTSIASILGKMGYRLTRVRPGRRGGLQDDTGAQRLIEDIRRSPDNAGAHVALARYARQRGMRLLAHAQACNARFLEPGQSTHGALARATSQELPPLAELGHNTFHRLQALVQQLYRAGLHKGDSLLDVGGGKGELAAFLPESRYFLADPSSNGLEAAGLPHDLNPFDYVVSCHVLEHVPPQMREAFLDDLVSRARHAVVLLNPFHIEGTSEQERLQLVIDLTGAHWAKEHLSCSLPHLSDIQRYAVAKDLSCTIEPVGALTTTLAYVLLEHYASRAGMASELRRINRFFNERLCEAEASTEFPTGFAITLRPRI